MSEFVVLQPGVQTTVQDLGRPGHSALGVARSGALDPLSLRIGNRLVGNDDGAAALELTLVGGALRCQGDVVLALTGAPLAATIERPGAPAQGLPRHAAVAAPAGSVLRLGGTAWGVRAYLCVRGGVAVPPVLGSRATQVAAALGGHHGRPLRAGDRVAIGSVQGRAVLRALPPRMVDKVDALLRQPALHATAGAHAPSFSAADRAAFWQASFTVSERCDRAGVRLGGVSLPTAPGGLMASEGLPRGAVEVPGPSELIVLLADGPPTGGYPTIACVASVDHARLGQLRPRETVRFAPIDLAGARELLLERATWLAREVPPR